MTLRLWNLSNPEASPVLFEGFRDVVFAVAFSSDGTSLAASADGGFRVWPLWSAAADHVCTHVHRNITVAEWDLYMGEGIQYETTCRNMPSAVREPGPVTIK